MKYGPDEPVVSGVRSTAVYGRETEDGPTRRSEWSHGDKPEHVVQFYETDDFILSASGDFIGTALRRGDIGLVIATGEHATALEERLRASGLDLSGARAAGTYVSADADELLGTFMADRSPDPERFAESVGGLVARAVGSGRRVQIFGEMVTLLVLEGAYDAAVQLEGLWNRLLKVHSFSLLCAYPMGRLGGEGRARVLDDVCAAHSRVVPAESYVALPSRDSRLRAIAVLQQRARWLEAEIEERKRTEEELRAALESEAAAHHEAEVALRLRDEFLSIAAHELRTPLTGLLGHSQLLMRQLRREGHLDPERLRSALEVITRHAGKLARLLNQLLDVGRLKDGELTLEYVPTDLTALVEQAVSDTQAFCDRHTITLEAEKHVRAQADPMRLEQVLANLLDNAVKYSPDGGQIEVTLSRHEGAWVELSVRDHGLGIPPEKQERIFDRFERGHGPGVQEGWGLGLYISRQIVEMHGGEIRVEAPPGGSRFIIRLPVDGGEQPTT